MKEALTARQAVEALLASLPKDVKLEISVEQLTALLRSCDTQRHASSDIASEPAFRTLDDPTGLPTPSQLVADGRGELTVRDASHVLEITEAAVVQAIRRGRLKARRVGSRLYLIEAASVRDYRKNAPQQAPHSDTDEAGGDRPAAATAA